MAKHSKLVAAPLAVLVTAALLSGCEDNGVIAPTGGQMLLSASPQTVVIDVVGGENSAQSELTVQVFDDANFPLSGVSIFFSTTGGVVHTLCTNGACGQIGGDCTVDTVDVDCALPPTRAVETSANGFATVQLTLSRDDPETVTVTAASGLLSQTTDVSRSDDFGNEPPVAVIDAFPIDPLLKGTPVTFDGRASMDPDGLISCYQWQITSSDPGRNEIVQGLNSRSLDRAYSTAQSLTVTLRVSDDASLNDPTVCQSIPGAPVPVDENLFNGSTTIQYEVVCSVVGPTANAGPNFTASSGDVTVRGGGSSGGDAAITEYRWDCQDGIHAFQFSEDATCTYNDPGTETAVLQITTECGEVSTDTVDIFVQ